MIKTIKYLPLLPSLNFAIAVAEPLPSDAKYLINNQIHQLTPRECIGDVCRFVGKSLNQVNIGYYQLTPANDNEGQLKHLRFEIRPLAGESGYNNTLVDAKHINVNILGSSVKQSCTYADMGKMTRPTYTYRVSEGTYSYAKGVLTVVIDDISIQWKRSVDDNARWAVLGPKYQHVTGPSTNETKKGRYTKALGFGYMTDSLGPSEGLNFDNHFTQGNLANSASAYNGVHYSNSIKGMVATSADVFPSKVNVFKRVGVQYSSIDRLRKSHSNTYSKITFNATDKLFYQHSMKTNDDVSMPTLIYENHGHIMKINKNGAESQKAFDSRHCWTHSDTSKTQGHNWIHLGAWDSAKNRIGHLVSVEVARNNYRGKYYPIISLAYARGR